ncbi:hypothetical protein RBWH47_04660 [Rhodopirellula baltica WH47]|uniref:Uncharacterized protein n=1 Tax=Rhodopirellula baltica WH47 TaxID=991778 RepID=F2ASH3_RHOBT|nr:hypothetical protein RBWH47_04660 [Rhodopirellula baltica WH47]
MDGTSPLMLEHRVLVQLNREVATRSAFAVYSAERSHWMVTLLLSGSVSELQNPVLTYSNR